MVNIANEASIVVVRTPRQTDDARKLCRMYLEWLESDYGIRLDFQGVEEELRNLPGDYAPPKGEFVVAYGGDRALGCIAVRPFKERTCEIKRLFVLPAARGMSLGRRLCRAILHEARQLGYSRAVLDTGGFMDAAHRVYQEAGFTDIPAYYDNPLPDIRYFGRDL